MMKVSIKTLLALILILLCELNSVFAIHTPRENDPSLRDPNGTHTGAVSQQPSHEAANGILTTLKAAIPSSADHIPSPSFDTITETLKKRLQFAPYYQVVPHQGNFQTSFVIPLPANYSPIKSLTFQYDSHNDRDSHFGVGWGLSLPRIERSVQGQEYAPLIMVGLGGGELIPVPEENYLVEQRLPLLKKILNRAELALDSFNFNAYRSFIDETGNSIIEILVNSKRVAFVVSSLNGDHYVFNESGQLDYACDLLGNGINFIWNGVLLQEINSPYHFSVSFGYTSISDPNGLDLPVFEHFTFAGLSQKLTSITYQHLAGGETPTRKVDFIYSENYLEKVAFAGAKFPLFKGDYAYIRPITSYVKNAYQSNDKLTPTLAYRHHLTNFAYDPKSNKQEVYIDLDNDWVVDKVIIDQTSKLKAVEDHMKSEYLYDKFLEKRDWNGASGRDGTGYYILPGRFSTLEPKFNTEYKTTLLYYKGKWDGATVNFEPHASFFNTGNIALEPYSFYVTNKDNPIPIRNRPHDTLNVPVVNTYPNAINYIDLNGDGQKDLIYCLGNKQYAYAQTEAESKKPSLLIRNILLLKGGSFASQITWPSREDMHDDGRRNLNVSIPIPNPLDDEGSSPLVFYQDIRPINEGAIFVSPRALVTDEGIGHSRAVSFQSNFKCGGYSIFHDFNQDGIVDVLTGRTLYLRGKDLVMAKTLTPQEYAKLFNIELTSLEDVTMGDLTRDGRLTLFNGKGIDHNPIDGESYIIRNGETEIIHYPAKNKLLSKMYSAFGGYYEIKYETTEGITTVSSITKDPNAGGHIPAYGDEDEIADLVEEVKPQEIPQASTPSAGDLRDEFSEIFDRYLNPGVTPPLVPHSYDSILADWDGLIKSLSAREEERRWLEHTTALNDYNFSMKSLEDKITRFTSEEVPTRSRLDISHDTPVFFKQSVVIEKYTYKDKYADPLTRNFIGFNYSRKVVVAPNKHYQSMAVDHTMSKDNSLPLTRHLSRPLLMAKPSSIQVLDEYSSVLKENLYTWDRTEFAAGKIIRLDNTQTITNKYDSLHRLITSVVTRFRKSNPTQHFFYTQEENQKGALDQEDMITNQVQYKFDPFYYLRYPVRERAFATTKPRDVTLPGQTVTESFLSLGPQVKLQGELFYHSNNAPGKVSKYLYGDIEKNFTYDNYGRLASVSNSNGYKQSIEYQDNLPIIKAVTDQSGRSTTIFDQLFMQPLSTTTVLGVTYNYTYSPEGILLTVSKNNQQLYSLALPMPAYPRLEVLERIVKFNAWGVEYLWYLDGFGRIENSATVSGNAAFFSGLILYGEGNSIWKQYEPYKFFPDYLNSDSSSYFRIGLLSRDSSRHEKKYTSENFFDSQGELFSSNDGHLFSSYLKTFKDRQNCQTVRIGLGDTNQYREDSSECYDPFGRVISTFYQGEEFSYKYSPIGELKTLPELDYEWNYDDYGQLINSIGKAASKHSPPWAATNYHYDYKTNTFNDYVTAREYHYDSLDRVTAILAKEQDQTSLSEQYNYKGSLLKQISYSNSQGKVLFTREFDYDDEGRMTSSSLNNIEEKFLYTPYGKLQRYQTLKDGAVMISNTYTYQGNLLKEISPIAKIKGYYADGKISGIDYSGLTLKHYYDMKSKDLSLISAVNDKENYFTERYNYSFYHELEDRLYASNTAPGSKGFEFFLTEAHYSYILPHEQKLLSEDLSQILDKNKKPVLRKNDLLLPTRDERGRVVAISDRAVFKWSNENLVGIDLDQEKFHFFYDGSGELLAACPALDKVSTESCTVKVNDDLFIHQGSVLKLDRMGGLPMALTINGKTYPLISDYLGNVRAMLSSDPTTKRKVLWRRDYSAWGFKAVLYNQENLEENKRLEQLTLWSFAGLIELPGMNKPLVDKEQLLFYFSKSRVYSPTIGEWMSVDPLVQSAPADLLSAPGNWRGVEYASGDPINRTDPQGLASPIGKKPVIITSDYGPRNTGILGASINHKGVDLRAPINTPVTAVKDGFIIKVGSEKGGSMIAIKHTDNSTSIYRHVSSEFEKGLEISEGQTIGNTCTGQNCGTNQPHLHFERIEANEAERSNPTDFIVRETVKQNMLQPLNQLNEGANIYEF
ncbi:MAG: peptidoglycan DD-metalloendopeptidase family protein [Oligoflexia bacterium]|nr:peptidoglycan DD-metalloendopeptidase family protein [Oligoflexia bacterium]